MHDRLLANVRCVKPKHHKAPIGGKVPTELLELGSEVLTFSELPVSKCCQVGKLEAVSEDQNSDDQCDRLPKIQVFKSEN